MGKVWKKLRGICIVCAATAVFYIFLTALGDVREAQSAEGRRVLEDSLRRAAVACYAAEGVYPPDVAYLETHYGVQIDDARYTVFYEIFAENLMPQITVVEHA